MITHKPDLNLALRHGTLEPCPDFEGGVAIRLGLAGIRQVGQDQAERVVAERVVAERVVAGPTPRSATSPSACSSTAPSSRRWPPGVFTDLGPDRRAAAWAADAAATSGAEHIPGLALGHDGRALPGMTTFELTSAACGPPASPPTATPTSSGAIPAGQLLDVPAPGSTSAAP
ncbi:hypothetical protein [Amycolatopsis sp. FDAARGOS 1241]|uniref:hypothetical protein n=1 Tax=Amycolatopsis sp. FDAARGOS 1241 TaxID=2778070 RepID=UPI001950EEB7|nr:hypothetical protein [Amycolatopsis sp. FDAARGOS 1241]QRP42787.1 hypothetical protein I6J71_25275 [Amycolatopsis sp. FDAARGOS 1241]